MVSFLLSGYVFCRARLTILHMDCSSSLAFRYSHFFNFGVTLIVTDAVNFFWVGVFIGRRNAYLVTFGKGKLLMV